LHKRINTYNFAFLINLPIASVYRFTTGLKDRVLNPVREEFCHAFGIGPETNPAFCYKALPRVKGPELVPTTYLLLVRICKRFNAVPILSICDCIDITWSDFYLSNKP
jgi:hypothetical protein